MNIDCDLILKNLYLDNKNSSSDYQKEIILKEWQNNFGHMYIGVQKTHITDHLFILMNIRVNKQMNASEFGLLQYKILQEKRLKDERIHKSNENNEGTKWLIPEYITHLFVMEIMNKFT